MPYVEHTWTNGETITAAKMNNIEEGIAEAAQSGGGSPWDAVIRLTHSNDSNADLPANLTPSIVSGSYSELITKINNGGCPCILVEYYHPWGFGFAVPMAYICYASNEVISIAIVGASSFGNWAVSHWGDLSWSSNDTVSWG